MARSLYPPEIRSKVAILKKYSINKDLLEFNCLHMYPQKGFAYPEGYIDSKFFQLWGFNFSTMEKKDLGLRDGIVSSAPMIATGIFADGSTYLRFQSKVNVLDGQCAIIKSIQL